MKRLVSTAMIAVFLITLVTVPGGCGGSSEAVKSENPVQDKQPPEHANFKPPAK